jgi:hypothetical protein
MSRVLSICLLQAKVEIDGHEFAFVNGRSTVTSGGLQIVIVLGDHNNSVELFFNDARHAPPRRMSYYKFNAQRVVTSPDFSVVWATPFDVKFEVE